MMLNTLVGGMPASSLRTANGRLLQTGVVRVTKICLRDTSIARYRLLQLVFRFLEYRPHDYKVRVATE